MKRSFEDYCREVQLQAHEIAEMEEVSRRIEHLRSFNLGRTIQRAQAPQFRAWPRVGWLLLGLTIGVACGRIYPNYLYPMVAHRVLDQASHFVRAADRPGFWSIWKNPGLGT